MAVRRWLGDTLLNAGLVTKQQLDEALAAQNRTGEKLGHVLVSLGYLSESDLQRSLCADAGIPYLADAELQPDPAAIALISSELAHQHIALPLKVESRHLVLVMADPFDLLAIRALTRAAGRSVRVVCAQRDAVMRAIETIYAGLAQGAVAQGGGGAVAAVSTSTLRLELTRGNPDMAPVRTQGRPGWPAPAPARVTGDDQNTAATVV